MRTWRGLGVNATESRALPPCQSLLGPKVDTAGFLSAGAASGPKARASNIGLRRPANYILL
jgi:hypothetical protein